MSLKIWTQTLRVFGNAFEAMRGNPFWFLVLSIFIYGVVFLSTAFNFLDGGALTEVNVKYGAVLLTLSMMVFFLTIIIPSIFIAILMESVSFNFERNKLSYNLIVILIILIISLQIYIINRDLSQIGLSNFNKCFYLAFPIYIYSIISNSTLLKKTVFWYVGFSVLVNLYLNVINFNYENLFHLIYLDTSFIILSAVFFNLEKLHKLFFSNVKIRENIYVDFFLKVFELLAFPCGAFILIFFTVFI